MRIGEYSRYISQNCLTVDTKKYPPINVEKYMPTTSPKN